MAGIEDVTPHIELDGADETAAAFQKIAAAALEAFNQIEQAASKVGGASQHISSMAEDGKKSLSELGSVGAEAFSKIIEAAMSGNFTGIITKTFGELAGTVSEAVAKLTEFTEAQAHTMETLSNLATATGMSTAEILGMREAFASVGISTSGFERAIGRLAITIGNEWSQIQHSVRTSADEQVGAMLHVQQTALNLEKAFSSMGQALSHSTQSAAHNALGIEQAALGLKKAQEALGDMALQSRQNALSIEGAELALKRAQMNLAKDEGRGVSPEDEKKLKIEQDKLAVKEAQLRLEEAQKKQSKEALEREEAQLKVKKAQQEVSDAAQKQAEDATKNAERIKQAELDIQKAKLATREASEKAHEMDLKDIPNIAKQVEQVAGGYKKWDEVMNHAEISAQNLTKAVILAASAGSGQPPKAQEVFVEMSKLFQNMGTSADAMNKKLELVQHTMGAGFRSGQASAAQLLAVLERGPEALEHFKVGMEKFADSLNLKKSEEQLKEFNSTFSQMEGTIDLVKTKFAGIISVPLGEFFKSITASLQEPEGALNRLVSLASTAIEKIAEFASSLGSKISENAGPLFQRLIDLVERLAGVLSPIITLVAKIASAFGGLMGVEKIFHVIAVAVDALNLVLDGLKITIGAITMAFGKLYEWVAKLSGATKAVEDAKKIQDVGQKMFEGGIKDATKDRSNLADDALKAAGVKLDEAGTKGEAAATKHEGAATKHEGAATKHEGASDRHSGAADKHSAASEKQAESASKLGEMASTAQNNFAQAADKLGQAASSLQTAGQALTSAAQASAAAAAGKAGADGAKAEGGMIRGPGGPTDDKAGLFALSDGEYVVRNAAVQHYGAPLFEALNSLAVGGFATGGMVNTGVSAPRAPASTTGPTSVLNLTIDGNQFNGLKAPEHVASKLKTYAVTRQSSSAGKMPSWMR